MDLQSNYSGEGMVETMKFKTEVWPGEDTSDMRKLDYVFRTEVMDNKGMAWYVDHFTEDPAQFYVRYLAVDPCLFWTNERIEERDPDDALNGQWGAEDVAKWFTDFDGVTHIYEVKFRDFDGIEHVLTLRPFSASVDDVADRWSEYVEFGVRGALEGFRVEKLIGIAHYVVMPTS